MGTLATVTTLGTGLWWRVRGGDRAAQALIETALGHDEDAATLAAMMLTKGGDRAVPLVHRAVADGHTELVAILLGVGTDRARAALTALSQSQDAGVAQASSRARDRLDRARNHTD